MSYTISFEKSIINIWTTVENLFGCMIKLHSGIISGITYISSTFREVLILTSNYVKNITGISIYGLSYSLQKT